MCVLPYLLYLFYSTILFNSLKASINPLSLYWPTQLVYWLLCVFYHIYFISSIQLYYIYPLSHTSLYWPAQLVYWLLCVFYLIYFISSIQLYYINPLSHPSLYWPAQLVTCFYLIYPILFICHLIPLYHLHLSTDQLSWSSHCSMYSIIFALMSLLYITYASLLTSLAVFWLLYMFYYTYLLLIFYSSSIIFILLLTYYK